MTDEVGSLIDKLSVYILQQALLPGLIPHQMIPIVDLAVSTAEPLLTAEGCGISYFLLRFDLAGIIQNYGRNKRSYSGPGAPQDIKKELDPLFTSLSETLRRYRLLSEDARQRISKWSALESSLSQAIRELRPQLEAKAKRGAPPNFPIEEAAKSLVQLWMHLRPHSYKKTLTFVLGENGEQEFVSEGPRFVGKTLRAIDPAIDLPQIATALRKLPVVQECSPAERLS